MLQDHLPVDLRAPKASPGGHATWPDDISGGAAELPGSRGRPARHDCGPDTRSASPCIARKRSRSGSRLIPVRRLGAVLGNSSPGGADREDPGGDVVARGGAPPGGRRDFVWFTATSVGATSSSRGWRAAGSWRRFSTGSSPVLRSSTSDTSFATTEADSRRPSRTSEPAIWRGGGRLPPEWRRLERLVGLVALCEMPTHDGLPDAAAARAGGADPARPSISLPATSRGGRRLARLTIVADWPRGASTSMPSRAQTARPTGRPSPRLAQGPATVDCPRQPSSAELKTAAQCPVAASSRQSWQPDR